MKYDFVLPLPPSVNAMYKTRGRFGFYKSKEAKDWERNCIRVMKVKKPIKGDLDVEIGFFFKRDGDIDNRIKALLDLMQHSGVFENDRQVVSLLVRKEFDKQDPHVCIRVIGN